MKKEFNFKGAKRGRRVDPKTTKVAKTIRLDMDIVAWLVKESDRTRIPYQTLINSLLKKAMDEHDLIRQFHAAESLDADPLAVKKQA